MVRNLLLALALVSSSAPALVCAAPAREVGSLRRFSVEGGDFGSEGLEICSRGAR